MSVAHAGMARRAAGVAAALGLTLAAAVAGLAAAAQTPTPETIAGYFEGRWAYAGAPEADPPAPPSSREYVVVNAPRLDGVLMAQRSFAPDGAVARVSLIRFEQADDGVAMTYVRAKAPERWGELADDLSALATVVADDLTFTPGCTITWRGGGVPMGYHGTTEPGACVSRRFGDGPVTVDAHHLITADTFTHNTRLTAADGAPVPYPSGPQPQVYAREP